jgi:hypothetical protein
MEKASAEMQKMSEGLQKLPPLTLDQLKAMIPEELMGVKEKIITLLPQWVQGLPQPNTRSMIAAM